MAMQEPDESAVRALGDAYRKIDRNLRKLRGRDSHLPDGQLGQARFELLNILIENLPMSVGELADAAGFTTASVSRMLDPLVKNGIVRRDRSETDRRVVRVSLTDEGASLVEARRAYWSDRWAAALEGASTADLEASIEIMGRIATIFVDVDPPLGPG